MNPSGSVRLTYQATPRNKIGFSAEPQNRHWINSLPATFSPEIYPDWQFNHESFTTATWSSPVTSRLLLEARFGDHAEGFVDKYPEAGRPVPPGDSACVRRAPDFSTAGKAIAACRCFFGTQNAPFTMQAQASVTYVTGSHALKVGFQNDFGSSAVAIRQRAGPLLHVQQRRAHLDPAACAAVYADRAFVGGPGHLRAGQVDVQAGDDQRGTAVRLLQEQFSRTDPRARVVRARPQSRDPGKRRTPT